MKIGNIQEIFDDNIKIRNLNIKTKYNYNVFIRRLKYKNTENVLEEDVIQNMNEVILECDKTGNNAMLARNAYINVCNVLNIENNHDKLLKVKVKERKVLKKWVSFDVLKKIIDHIYINELQLQMIVQ